MPFQQRYFAYGPDLWEFFRRVDRRFAGPAVGPVVPADVEPLYADLGSVRAMLWDVYGTLCGIEPSDPADASNADHFEGRRRRAAGLTIEQFDLGPALRALRADQPAEDTLCDLYQRRIEESHQRARAAGIEYPEVRIEQIWDSILDTCRSAGARLSPDESPQNRAYQTAYFFDAAFQRNFLYPDIAECLAAIRRSGRFQGIISNAQFYTPLVLRRLLRQHCGNDNLGLEAFFDEPLVCFSYEAGFSKPNPRAFERALAALAQRAIPPEQVLYIGNDMLNDIWAASQSGMRTLLFAADRTQTVLRVEDESCRQLQPDAIATDARQIMEMVSPRPHAIENHPGTIPSGRAREPERRDPNRDRPPGRV